MDYKKKHSHDKHLHLTRFSSYPSQTNPWCPPYGLSKHDDRPGRENSVILPITDSEVWTAALVSKRTNHYDPWHRHKYTTVKQLYRFHTSVSPFNGDLVATWLCPCLVFTSITRLWVQILSCDVCEPNHGCIFVWDCLGMIPWARSSCAEIVLDLGREFTVRDLEKIWGFYRKYGEVDSLTFNHLLMDDYLESNLQQSVEWL